MCSMFNIEDIKCLRLTIFDMSFLDLHYLYIFTVRPA
jgi:hypothetical protein